MFNVQPTAKSLHRTTPSYIQSSQWWTDRSPGNSTSLFHRAVEPTKIWLVGVLEPSITALESLTSVCVALVLVECFSAADLDVKAISCHSCTCLQLTHFSCRRQIFFLLKCLFIWNSLVEISFTKKNHFMGEPHFSKEDKCESCINQSMINTRQ